MNSYDVKNQLDEHGYAIVEDIVSKSELEALQLVGCVQLPLDFLINASTDTDYVQECETLREIVLNAVPDEPWAAAAKTSCVLETSPPAHLSANPQMRTSYDLFKDRRSTWPLRQAIWDILFASHLTELIYTLLGPDSCLFNEQYIVKPSRSGSESAFAWHRDSDWCRDNTFGSYISVWVALDNVHSDNGGLLVRPGSHCAATMTTTDDSLLDRKHVAIHLTAGSAVILSDSVVHKSGPNPSQYSRRAWMPQFSSSPVICRSTHDPVSLAIPLRLPLKA
jgi:hypothetical protein